jgi:hypothetical protein
MNSAFTAYLTYNRTQVPTVQGVSEHVTGVLACIQDRFSGNTDCSDRNILSSTEVSDTTIHQTKTTSFLTFPIHYYLILSA